MFSIYIDIDTVPYQNVDLLGLHPKRSIHNVQHLRAFLSMKFPPAGREVKPPRWHGSSPVKVHVLLKGGWVGGSNCGLHCLTVMLLRSCLGALHPSRLDVIRIISREQFRPHALEAARGQTPHELWHHGSLRWQTPPTHPPSPLKDLQKCRLSHRPSPPALRLPGTEQRLSILLAASNPYGIACFIDFP